jgi:hypothetical protein
MKTHWHWVKGWAKGTFQDGKAFVAPVWAGSDESEEKAYLALDQKIQERLAAWKNRSSKKSKEVRLGDYGLSDLAERLLERGESPELGQWAITRNGYGCRTLCVEKLFIADIDCYHWNPWGRILLKVPGVWGRLRDLCLSLTAWGRAKVAQEKKERFIWESAKSKAMELWPEASTERLESLTRICKFGMEDSSLSFDIHRTTRGFRVIERSRAWDARAQETLNLMQQLGCDELYMTLCRKQDCFRARLEAKPWRCGSVRPPVKYPFNGIHDEQAFTTWLNDFQDKAKHRRACAWIGHLGADSHWEPARALCKLHEEQTGSHETTKRLA